MEVLHTQREKHDGTLSKEKPFELIAYVEYRELAPLVRLSGYVSSKPGFRLIQSNITHRYLLTDVDAQAYLYFGNKLIGKVPLNDDAKTAATIMTASDCFTVLLIWVKSTRFILLSNPGPNYVSMFNSKLGEKQGQLRTHNTRPGQNMTPAWQPIENV